MPDSGDGRTKEERQTSTRWFGMRVWPDKPSMAKAGVTSGPYWSTTKSGAKVIKYAVNGKDRKMPSSSKTTKKKMPAKTKAQLEKKYPSELKSLPAIFVHRLTRRVFVKGPKDAHPRLVRRRTALSTLVYKLLHVLKYTKKK